MSGTPYEERDEERLWPIGCGGDEGEERRLVRNLRLAREEELTQRQREVLRLHFEERLGVREIARRQGAAPSTVSRTLARAKRRLYKCLRYGL